MQTTTPRVRVIRGTPHQQTRHTLEHSSWSEITDELPETTTSGNPINYTVTVTGVDGSVIASAAVSGNNTVNVGEKVKITADVVEPPKTFTLNLNPSWVNRNTWNWSSPTEEGPTNSNAWFKVRLTKGSTYEDITISASNNWGKSLDKVLDVYDSDGKLIQYSIDYNDQNENRDGTYVGKGIEKWLPENTNANCFTGDNGDVTVSYVGSYNPESSGGGDQGGGDSGETVVLTITADSFKDKLDNTLSTLPESGSIIAIVRNGNWAEKGRVTLNAQNNFTATVEVPKNESVWVAYESDDFVTSATGNNSFSGSDAIAYYTAKTKTFDKTTNVYFTVVKTDSNVTSWQMQLAPMTGANQSYSFSSNTLGPSNLQQVMQVPVRSNNATITYSVSTYYTSCAFSWIAYSGTTQVGNGNSFPISFDATDKNVYIDITIGDGNQDGETVIKTDSVLNLAKSAPARRTLMAAPRKAPASTNKTFTILGTGDKTPLDAVAIGDPITLSNGNWTHKWENLPTTDEDGNPIYYYVRELSASVDSTTTSITTSYDYEKHNNADAREGYKKVTVTNTAERKEPEYGSVKVTKAFVGLPSGTLPSNFKITNSVNSTEFTVDNKAGGTGTELDPYFWTIGELPVGTEVTFTESGYDVKGYNVSITGSANAATATATAAKAAPGTANFVNTYTEKKTSFKFNKIWLDASGSVDDSSSYQSWQQSITVTIKRKVGNGNPDTDFELKYVIASGEGTVNPDSSSKRPNAEGKVTSLTLTVSSIDNIFSFTLPENMLKKCNAAGDDWIYYVEEIEISPYVTKYGSITETEGGKTASITQGAAYASDGGVIVNQTFGGYELPSTGGPGTNLMYLLGSILIAGAGLMLVWKRRRMV